MRVAELVHVPRSWNTRPGQRPRLRAMCPKVADGCCGQGAVSEDPKLRGFRALSSEARKSSSVPIVILSAQNATHDIVAGGLGADVYVMKPFKDCELLARVRVQLRSPASAGPADRVVVGDLEICPSEGEVLKAGEPVHLTRTEFLLLCELAAHHGQASLSRKVVVATSLRRGLTVAGRWSARAGSRRRPQRYCRGAPSPSSRGSRDALNADEITPGQVWISRVSRLDPVEIGRLADEGLWLVETPNGLCVEMTEAYIHANFNPS